MMVESLLESGPGQASGREIWIWTFQFLVNPVVDLVVDPVVDPVVNPVDHLCGNRGEYLGEYLETGDISTWVNT